ncbi:hypothetical protein JOB18_033962 [Solea senegalensis]|uniref:Uncharacterized protein n=1 Tax=Solea senegalensis TaxID=28829 RepID=A0AAV6R2E8_SOLSE|nr:hypothetical protein JOB18_033962 [Solea senegalensis]
MKGCCVSCCCSNDVLKQQQLTTRLSLCEQREEEEEARCSAVLTHTPAPAALSSVDRWRLRDNSEPPMRMNSTDVRRSERKTT